VLDSLKEEAFLLLWRQPVEALHSDITQHVGIEHRQQRDLLGHAGFPGLGCPVLVERAENSAECRAHWHCEGSDR